jgi:protocatechuate 3,4-dioxygenase beta subunit
VPAEALPRLVSRYDHELTQPSWALAYVFDIVLRGPEQTPFEDPMNELGTAVGQDE